MYSSRFIEDVAGPCSFMIYTILLVVTTAEFFHRNFGISVERHDFLALPSLKFRFILALQ